MPNTYFQFKQFRIDQEKSGMKVTTDGCLFGAWVADEMKRSKKEPQCILDLGTGTGLLSLMVAQATKNSCIDAIEINEAAFKEAKQNFEKSKWGDRLNVLHTSLQNFQSHHLYDLIICNPPFFKANLKGFGADKNQAIHSDTLSAEDLANGISILLSKGGTVYVMYPEWEMEQFSKLIFEKGLKPMRKIEVKNTNESDPMRIIASFGYDDQTIDKQELVIRNGDGTYSKRFSRLLETYYL